MSDLKFILGFVAGWIVTTEEGKITASKIADKTIKSLKKYVEKNAQIGEE